MVAIIACNCEEGMGLPHSHVSQMLVCMDVRRNKTITVTQDTFDLNSERLQILRVIPPTIHTWINWKDFGASLLRDPVGS